MLRAVENVCITQQMKNMKDSMLYGLVSLLVLEFEPLWIVVPE
jgi:hypothetical protein